MKKFNVNISIRVVGSKYRELMNILERELLKEMPATCLDKDLFQSVDDLNMIIYKEVWSNLDNLKSSLKSTRFELVRGAVKSLAESWELEIFEAIEFENAISE